MDQDQQQEGVRLYVGNLPYKVRGRELGEHFNQAGDVLDSIVILDKRSGRSKGFGFVTLATDEQAQKAIEMFHGQDFEGRPLVVNIARPREERPPMDDSDMGSGPMDEPEVPMPTEEPSE